MKAYLSNVSSLLASIPKKILYIVLFLAILLLAIRVLMPLAAEHFINKKLSQKEGFTGKVEDVDFVVLLGRFRVEGISIGRTAEYRKGGRPSSNC